MPVLDHFQRESFGVMHEREMSAEPKPERRSALELLPQDVVEGGKKAVDLMGKIGFVDLGTGMERLADAWTDDGSEVGAELRRSYEAARESFQETKTEARASRVAAPAERRTSTVGFDADRTSQGLTAMSDLAIEGLQQDIEGWQDSEIRDRYLDAITAELERRTQ